MSRTVLTCCLASLALAAAADAHFVFIVPDRDGKTAKVVFSENLTPDENVAIGKIAATKLSLHAGGGKPAALDWTKGEHAYTLKVPGEGPRVVQGTTDFGVMQKKADRPYLLRYHPRAVLGSPKAGALKPNPDLAVEVLPVTDGGKVRFLVASKGKPLADTEVNVLLPTDRKKKVKTDDKGLTPAFEDAGRYGVWVRHLETASGELGGKKYEQVRHYATLVFDLPGKGK